MTLLAQPGWSVLDVSVAVGFESASSFARAFAQHFGEAPSSYRSRVAPAHDGGPATRAAAGR